MEAALSTYYGTSQTSLNSKGGGSMFLWTLVSTYKTIRCLNSKDRSLYTSIRKYVRYINTGSPCQGGNFFDIAVKRESLYINNKALSYV
jgi:hypothetical protein